jgi:hypothetical protein
MPGFKFQTSLSSGEKTSDTTILTGAGWITGIQLITDGTNDATALLYDNTASSGKKVYEGKVVGANNYGGRNWVFPIKVSIGIRLDISGTGASAIIEYIPNV